MIFFKNKTRRNNIPKVNGLELYNLIGSITEVDNNNLDFYMPAVKKIKERIEDAYNTICYRGQSKRIERSIFSNMQMGFFCNIFSWIAVCNYKAAWSDFYKFARCDRWAHKGYFLSAQEIVSVKYILNAFEKAGEMPQMYSYDILYNKSIYTDKGIRRKEISEHMENNLEGQNHISYEALKKSIEFIDYQIKKQFDEHLYEDITEVDYDNECYKPSLRQIRTLLWCIEEIEKGNAPKAYYYLFEYIDNYQEGFNTSIKGFEIQVIHLLIVLLRKLI